MTEYHYKAERVTNGAIAIIALFGCLITGSAAAAIIAVGFAIDSSLVRWVEIQEARLELDRKRTEAIK